ncbi:transposase [Bradyrhizobium sp. Pha-3]|uniref:transposase n=1 Tax=Bradyrhizobium sp. Pha-3 TaxID=208375 RepID=UPI0035D4A8CC
MIFGKRSERLAVIVAAQLALKLGDLETDATKLPAPTNDSAPATKPSDKPRKKARRNIGGLPKHLPRCDPGFAAAVLRRDAHAGARSRATSHPYLPVLGACHG